MRRVAVIGNAGGGKSTVARALSAAHDLPYVEVDALQWTPAWTPREPGLFEAEHAAVLAQDRWVLDGFGSWASVERRFAAADSVILVDLPLWVHFWLAAERQIAWHLDPEGSGRSERPAGHRDPPPTRDLFEMIWRLDQESLPRLRELVAQAESAGSCVVRLESLEAQEAFVAALAPRTAPG